ncbi:hypothetical protein [Roseivirga sp. 4D4]|uniref:hypothetical protein n=1 Tax=Roseivirga sp. 4D4 TaxID=1889784 RepID=UPI001112DECD|nr:hypothetical protein [Roseivirga sp. 4D4]
MRNKGIVVVVTALLTCLNLSAQSSIDDTDQLKELINSISKGVNSQKSNLILDAFIHPSALIYSTFRGLSSGEYSKKSTTAQGLADFVKNSEEKINQEFDFIDVEMIDAGRAIVKTYYRVQIDGKKSHMGDEFYSVIKTKGGWKIISLMFTMELWSD